MELAKTLKALRETYGDNIIEFSHKLRISRDELINIEHDIDKPSSSVLNAYSRVLEIKVSNILLMAETDEELKHEPFFKRSVQPFLKRIALRGGEK